MMTIMRATVIHAAGDVRLDELPDPQLLADTDAIVLIVATCVCGSDLWKFRGLDEIPRPTTMGHEMVGVVESVGSTVATVAEGDFVIAPFSFCDNTCALCALGVHTSCVNGGYWSSPDGQGLPTGGCQAELIRIPFADGTLVKTPSMPDAEMIPHLLALSDVFPTGHHAAVSAGVTPGSNVAVVGDGAVGLSAVLAAKRLGAGKIVAMSRHKDRQDIARAFGADEIVEGRDKSGAAQVREIFDGIGADFVLECVGTHDSMKQGIMSTRPGGTVGYVGLPHGVNLNLRAMFSNNVSIRGGVAPVRHYLDGLVPEVLDGRLAPGIVFDGDFGLGGIADAYRAMDERRTTKAYVTP